MNPFVLGGTQHEAGTNLVDATCNGIENAGGTCSGGTFQNYYNGGGGGGYYGGAAGLFAGGGGGSSYSNGVLYNATVPGVNIGNGSLLICSQYPCYYSSARPTALPTSAPVSIQNDQFENASPWPMFGRNTYHTGMITLYFEFMPVLLQLSNQFQ